MNNYQNFINNLKKTAQLTDRKIDEIDLIAVSKKKSAQDIQGVIEEGHTSFGENQIQEIERKWPDLKKLNPNIQLHFIGNIQSRKVESIHEHCEVIHSVDRMNDFTIFMN